MFKPVAFLTVLLSTLPALGQEKTVEDQTLCPIMTKKKVDGESKLVEYKGVAIRMCCDTCVDRFNANPEAYLNEKYIPQLNGMEIPKRKIAQTFCPVYPDRVITEKDRYVIYEGHKVYLFNKAAQKKWLKNPAKYAKPELLPQLKDPPESDLSPYVEPAVEEEEEEEDSDK
jgi:YHS domain-containing protein